MYIHCEIVLIYLITMWEATTTNRCATATCEVPPNDGDFVSFYTHTPTIKQNCISNQIALKYDLWVQIKSQRKNEWESKIFKNSLLIEANGNRTDKNSVWPRGDVWFWLDIEGQLKVALFRELAGKERPPAPPQRSWVSLVANSMLLWRWIDLLLFTSDK